MKRRLLMATLGATALAGCQALRGGGATEQPQQTIELKVTNKSDEEDNFDLVVATENNKVDLLDMPLKPGGGEYIGSWKGPSFTIFGISNTFTNFEVKTIGAVDKPVTYRIHFIIKKSGDVITREFGEEETP